MSDKKLNENKQMLNEDWSYFLTQILPVFTIGLFAAIRIGFALLDNSNFKQSRLSKAVYNSLDDLYNDKEFVKDFVSILKKEGNLQDIVDNLMEKHRNKDSHYQYYQKGSSKRSGKEDKRFYKNYIYTTLISGRREWEWDAPVKRIIDNVIKSNGYKKFSKKHKFTSEDDTTMRALFYYMMSRPDFAVNVKKYLYAAVEQNKSVIINAIDKVAFDRDTEA